jgi:hypothetical protein
MTNIIEFPGNTVTPEQKSQEITQQISAELVKIMDGNGINIQSENFVVDSVGLIKIVQAVVDSQLGLKNNLSQGIRDLGQKLINGNK